MIRYASLIKKFTDMGEKSGWSYVDIPQHIANEIKPGCRVSFRVKGKIDDLPINGIALVPMGEGDFILPLKLALRKSLRKEKGAIIALQLEEDKDFKIEMPEDLYDCLSEQAHLLANFLKQPKSHQNYFIKWIDEAKTEPTRIKRLVQTVQAMDREMDFGAMIRANKKKL
jgi:hypothetical protein